MLDAVVADPLVTAVTSVARRPVAPRPKLRHVRADLRHPDARAALAGVDVLYHLGFQLWSGRGGPDAMRAANLEGTANVLAGRPVQVVLASSAAVYGAWPDNPLPLTEAAPPRPNRECPYAEHKLAVEATCTAAAPTIALRLGAVLGPHADRAVARSVRGYRLAVPAVRGAGEALQFVDEADAVAAVVAAGRLAVGGPAAAAHDARGPVPLVVNVATDDWLDAAGIAAVTGGRVLRLPLRVLIAASEAGRRARLAPFGADRAVLVNGPLALDNHVAARTLGWRPTRPSVEVLAAASGRQAAAQKPSS